MQSKSVNQYLEKYAELEISNIVSLKNCYDFVVVLPICNESRECLETIFSKIKENILIIVVVNAPKDKKQWLANNQLFIDKLLRDSLEILPIAKSCNLLTFQKFPDVLLVDKNGNDRQVLIDKGVGQARKIGCDIALKLYTLGCINSQWICSTDADVVLPKNYFIKIALIPKSYSAIVLDFVHINGDERIAKLQYLYDLKLRYYLTGLIYANSHYCYIPLGSCLIVNMGCYALVRGFPKRSAGEDFYLLNKLAKVRPIKYLLDECTVSIRSRISDRVPFGTGPALKAIDELITLDDYKYYNPVCFIWLKKWQSFLDNRWFDNALYIETPKDKVLCQLYVFFACEKVFNKCIRQITSKSRWQQFIHQWFDAFKTLKAIHFFDKKFARLNYKMLLNNDSFAKVTNSTLNNFIKLNDKI